MTWRRVLLCSVVLVAAVAVVLGVGASGMTVDDVQAVVAAAGIWGPLLFVLVHGAVSITPIPRTLFTISAGALFGPFLGLLLSIVGTTLAATGAFFLVRFVGRRFVERHAHRRQVTWVRVRLDRNGLLAVASLRLIPAVPFPAMNYAAGLSGVRFLPYVIGTVLGVLPGTVATVVLADAATGGSPHPAVLVISVVCGLIGLVGAVIAARRPVPVTAEEPDRADGSLVV